MDDYSKPSDDQHSVGAVTSQLATFETPFDFVRGGRLSAWQLCYETYGELNADKSNAVLICHALSGSQHAAGWYHDNPKNRGWWDNFIGPGKPIDTRHFFVLCPNNLGGCHGSTGPAQQHPDDHQPYGSRFPIVTVEDWVRSQKQLAERLGIDRFIAVVGGSLGGMQAMRWAIDYPDGLGAAIIIAASARLTALNIAFNDIARLSIMGDSNFFGGDFYQQGEAPKVGLGVARMLGHVTYLTDQTMAQKFGRSRRMSTGSGYGVEFEIESYLRYQGNKFSNQFDANTYLLMTRALDYFDPASDADGDLSRALAPALAKFFLLSFSSDWRFPSVHSEEIVRALLVADKQVSYLEIDADTGHDSFLLANPVYHQAVATFMRRLMEEETGTSCSD